MDWRIDAVIGRSRRFQTRTEIQSIGLVSLGPPSTGSREIGAEAQTNVDTCHVSP